ncbi:DUF1116 domain-containing protein [Marinobacter sp.]|uniref:oxamate carbamoyltransferase subunit AllG family protein n=1 Tax=Marinobacter sp. TaxID=50741 RepID=UPI002B2681F1|nr:DUF1116 domain-containing protein [Marinobacter sp.]
MEIDRHTKFNRVLLKGVSPRAEVLPNLNPLTLLHAGPPFTGSDIPVPVRNAAIHALIFERLAETPDDASTLIDSGKVHFEPAQDWRVVTPLAQVVSASMPLFVIGEGDHEAFAPVVEGAPTGLRFGSSDPQCRKNLETHAQFAKLELAPQLKKSPVRIGAIIEKALAEGNDCHTLTDRANAALLDQLDGLSDPYLSLLESSPGFVLPILMGACSWWLQFGSSADENGRGVVAAGGNGERFGMRLRGQTDWTTVLATPPVGKRFAHQEDRPVVGAIGDSAVIDFCGLGGQALECAPALVSDWQNLLPEDWQGRPESVLSPQTDVVCPWRVIEHQKPPIINLALVSADAQGGILGKGFYQPDLAVFEAVVAGATS